MCTLAKMSRDIGTWVHRYIGTCEALNIRFVSFSLDFCPSPDFPIPPLPSFSSINIRV